MQTNNTTLTLFFSNSKEEYEKPPSRNVEETLTGKLKEVGAEQFLMLLQHLR